MHRFYRNWQIYQHDIVYMGGSVTYLGNVLKRDRRSYIQDALVSLSGSECVCRMECFADGTCVIAGFVENGRVRWGNLFPEANAFLRAYDSCRVLLDNNRLFRMTLRNVLQVLTLLLQAVLFFFAGKYFISFLYSHFLMFDFIRCALCLFSIVLAGRLYTVFRRL